MATEFLGKPTVCFHSDLNRMMPSPRAEEDDDVLLRRLRDDVNAFQNLDVQRALLNVDCNRREPIQRTVPVLEAELIEIRTSLTASTEKISKLESEIVAARNQLEEERGRILRLETMLKATEFERDTFAARVSELERDHLNATKSASENAALLSLSSMGVSQRVGQLESDLEVARAALVRTEAELGAVKMEHESDTRELDNRIERFEEDTSAMLHRIASLEASNAQLVEEHKRLASEAESNISTVSNRASTSAAEVAVLRVECANRVEEIREARADCAAKLNEVRKVRAEMTKKGKELESVAKMQEKIRGLEKELARAKNANELVDALREEKTMLKGLISSLAPSGLPADGLKILRDIVLNKTLAKHYKSNSLTAVSSKELKDITSRLRQYENDIVEARKQTVEARVAQKTSEAKCERTKRLKERAEAELEILRNAREKSALTVNSTKSDCGWLDEYKRIIVELETVILKKEEELVKASLAEVPSEILGGDLIRLLEAQLRATERERDDALASKTSVVTRLGVKDGRIGKGGAKKGGKRR